MKKSEFVTKLTDGAMKKICLVGLRFVAVSSTKTKDAQYLEKHTSEKQE